MLVARKHLFRDGTSRSCRKVQVFLIIPASSLASELHSLLICLYLPLTNWFKLVYEA
jgi:hypothetical protein